MVYILSAVSQLYVFFDRRSHSCYLCVCVCVFAFVMRLLFSGKSPRANLHPLTFSGYLCVHH